MLFPTAQFLTRGPTNKCITYVFSATKYSPSHTYDGVRYNKHLLGKCCHITYTWWVRIEARGKTSQLAGRIINWHVFMVGVVVKQATTAVID